MELYSLTFKITISFDFCTATVFILRTGFRKAPPCSHVSCYLSKSEWLFRDESPRLTWEREKHTSYHYVLGKIVNGSDIYSLKALLVDVGCAVAIRHSHAHGSLKKKYIKKKKRKKRKKDIRSKEIKAAIRSVLFVLSGVLLRGDCCNAISLNIL